MPNLLRATRSPLFLLLAAAALPITVLALDATGWKSRQAFTVAQPGIVDLTLPPSTLDAARGGLEDLRLIDADGHETPYLLRYAAPTVGAPVGKPKSFRAILDGSTTRLVIETGTDRLLTAVVVATPNPAFLKAARVEASEDGEHWRILDTGVPLFRQFGAEQVALTLDRRSSRQLRITIDDDKTPPVPFTGATLLFADSIEPAATVPLTEAHLERRDDYAGESVLVVDLGARHVPLASIEFAATDALFARKITVGYQELQNDTAVERKMGGGSIFRLAVSGIAPASRLDVLLAFSCPSRELLVHIENGDSPPLAINSVAVTQHPVSLIFSATSAGAYALLTGNAEAGAPHYDVATFRSELKAAKPSAIAVGRVEPNPLYRRHDSLAETPLLGGPIDPAAWRWHKSVLLTSRGVQQLEMDPDVLAGTENDLADLRLVRDGTQVPYVLERPTLSRPITVVATLANETKRPRVSRWVLKLPRARIPINRLTLTSPTPLFHRRLRVVEPAQDDRGASYEQSLADVEWSKTPGDNRPLTIPLAVRPTGDTLVLETDNGDNPPIVLAAAEVAYPVARLLFKSDEKPLALYYGNVEAEAPRYDIALIADQLVAAEKNIALLDSEVAAKPARRSLIGAQGGIALWGALALVVAVLLAVVAKLLPKPQGPENPEA